jgi:methionine synthase I (cobalamin-dependent)
MGIRISGSRSAPSIGWTWPAGAFTSPGPRPPTAAGPTRSRSSINGDVDTPDGRETIRLLARAFEEEPPDLILMETLSLVRTSTYATVEALLDTGLPVWLSFRRCRHGVCGVYGEHWGGPEGDAFGRAARRFEEMGVGALAINCIPPDHVPGMLSWLRDFTDLPLGVYPNLGYLSAAGWRVETGVGGAEWAALAQQWRDEGAQIIGGCCGVGPGHVAATRAALAGAACFRWSCRTSRASPACSCPRPEASWRGSTSTGKGSAPTSGASTSAAAPVC